MRVFANTALLDGYAQSGVGIVNSTAFRVENMVGCSLSVTVASGSSLVASASLEASNDAGNVGVDDISGLGVTHWTTLPNTGATAAQSLSGTAGTILFNVDGVFFKWIRVKVTGTSGTGTVSVRATGKGQA